MKFIPHKDPKTSTHILNASSNLLGICFVVLTSLRLLALNDKTVIDELTVAATILFMTSCIFSFISIRNDNGKLEYVADVLFITGLLLLFVTTVLFSLNLIH
ncbi:MAG: hypothetical protein IPP51_12615 [Bacteroidetes bacterium]|nr:hypothetical protein [Bacteroidota bacterium]